MCVCVCVDPYQRRRIPTPNLSDWGFLVGRQVRFPILLVHGQVNIGAKINS